MRRRRPGRATHGALKSRTQMLGDALGLAWEISLGGRFHGPQAVTSWFSDWNMRSWRSPTRVHNTRVALRCPVTRAP